jgi:DNA-binding transcriptional regulator YdaS (Cro superfamily)
MLTTGQRDAGLKKAIAAAGGIRPLARVLGIDPASVARWTRVPYEHIIAIEEKLNVDRAELRPELYLRWRGAKAASSRRP